MTKDSFGIVDEQRDPYKCHRGLLIEVTTGHARYIGNYAGLREREGELCLFPSLAWDVNERGEPIMKMNEHAPRFINLRAVDNIGPISQGYVEFFVQEQLRQFLEQRDKPKLSS